MLAMPLPLGTVKDRHRLKGLGWSISKGSALGLTWSQAGDGAREGVDVEAEVVAAVHLYLSDT